MVIVDSILGLGGKGGGLYCTFIAARTEDNPFGNKSDQEKIAHSNGWTALYRLRFWQIPWTLIALHETFLTAVEEELLKLGADVNARNKEGETPLFTTVDQDAVPLYISHGANLEIRNNKGKTAMEAANERGPLYVEAFRKALQNRKNQ